MTKTSTGLLIAALMLLIPCVVLLGQRQRSRATIAEQKLYLTELQRPPSSLLQTIRTAPAKMSPAEGAAFEAPVTDEIQRSPDYQMGIRIQAEVNARRRAGDFKSWAGISSGGFEELVELLGKQEIEFHGQRTSADQSLTQDQARLRNGELWARHEAQIKELLGSARYRSWKDWQDGAGAREWARDLNERLRPADGVNQEEALRVVVALRKVELEIRSEPRSPAESRMEHAARAHQQIHSAMALQLSPVQLRQFEILQKEKLEAMGTLEQLIEEERNHRGT